jgi:sulfur-oxidizing protein SoxY
MGEEVLKPAPARRTLLRRALAWAASACAAPAVLAAADPFEGDPFKSNLWPDLKKEFLGPDARAVFDPRVKVQGPAFAEDPMNVPITVSALDLAGVERIMVLVDRNPIRKVLELSPVAAQPAVAFRFKLEQGSPVRALVLVGGVWHVGGAWVDSAGGGCTVSGATRKDGSWTQTLGQVSGRVFSSVPGQDGSSRLRVRVMHPMDTGLVNGIPAFYVKQLSIRDGRDRELARMQTFEPVSENPVFSFDFATPPPGPLRIVGVDNNGNRINSVVQ